MEISEVDRLCTRKNDSKAFSCLIEIRKKNDEKEGGTGHAAKSEGFREGVRANPFDAAVPSINLDWGTAVGCDTRISLNNSSHVVVPCYAGLHHLCCTISTMIRSVPTMLA